MDTIFLNLEAKNNMEPTYTWSQIEKAIDAHNAALIKQVPPAVSPGETATRVAMIGRIEQATLSIKRHIKTYLEEQK